MYSQFTVGLSFGIREKRYGKLQFHTNVNTLLGINFLSFVNGSSERLVYFSFAIYKGLHYDLIKTILQLSAFTIVTVTKTSRQLRFRKGMDSNNNATIRNHRFTSFIAAYEISFLLYVLWDGNGFRVHISHSPFLEKAERKRTAKQPGN